MRRARAAGSVLIAVLCAAALSCRGAGVRSPEELRTLSQPLVDPPLLIAHRGASGYRPAHTLLAFELAIAQGADALSMELVSTKDGALIVQPDHELSATTDIAARFPTRLAKKQLNGATVSGWFSEDFTLTELKTVRVRESLPFRDHTLDGQWPLLTFEEVLVVARKLSAERGRGRPVGLYPELKLPSYFASLGLPLEEKLLDALVAENLLGYSAPPGDEAHEVAVYVASAEPTALRTLRGLVALRGLVEARGRLRLIQILDDPGLRPLDLARASDPRTFAELATPASLQEIRDYADGIAPHVEHLHAPAGRKGRRPTPLIAEAHRAGLLVHVFRFGHERDYLQLGSRRALAGEAAELAALLRLGVDGVFTDFPDLRTLLRSQPR